jgi:transcriptional regulator with XRE-family HTH domain
MGRARPTATEAHGRQEAEAIAGTLGRMARDARRLRRLSQEAVAARVGCSRARYAELERGSGSHAPLDLWVRIGLALERPIAVTFSRERLGDGAGEPDDAGHLAAQELVLRLARMNGLKANVELATSTARMPHVGDLVLRNDRFRVLLLIEVINRAGDLGAVARASDRKVVDLQGLAILIGGEIEPYRVVIGWLLVDTAANRLLVNRYPEFLRARNPGSSRLLTAALMSGGEPPSDAAMAWIDPRIRRVSPMRLRVGFNRSPSIHSPA